MIELPDVERMIEGFAGYATGKTVKEIHIDDDAIDINAEEAEEHLAGEVIEAVTRQGKFVVIRFRSAHSLVVDMGSDGKIYLDSQTAPPEETSKIRLQFAAGKELRFSSPGEEGTVYIVAGDDFSGLGSLQSLGLDPLSEELTAEAFVRLSQGHPRSTLKGLLLNQEVVAGIGNEYADEICFQAGYRPDLKISVMSADELEKTHLYLRRVLRRATLHWQAAHSDPGWLINHRKAGTACPRCAAALKSMRVSGLATFLCTRCQQAA